MVVETSAPTVLALDVGTSSVRAIPFDALGNPVGNAIGRRALRVEVCTDGGVTLDPDAMVAATVDAVADCVTILGSHARSLQGVGVSVFMHGLVGCRADGSPTTPILMWSDTRSVDQVEFIAQEFGREQLVRRTGCPAHTSFAPSKLLWLRTHARSSFDETRWWMSAGDYLMLRLFGDAGCSLSMASSLGLVDVNTGRWDTELLDFLDVDLDRVPEIRRSGAAYERVARAQLSQALGIVRDIPWFPPNADGACSNVGCGALDRAACALNLGTSAAMRVMDPGLGRSVPRALWCYLTNDGTPYVGSALSNAGNLFEWLSERLRLPDAGEIGGSVRPASPDEHGLTMLPFLYGERGVGWNASSTATIVGFNVSTTPGDVLCSALETVAIRLRLIFESVRRHVPDVERVIAGGGGLGSPVWVQMIADALGMPIWKASVAEASARGAALYALRDLAAIDTLASIPPELTLLRDPDATATERYARAAERHSALYDSLSGGLDV